MQRILAIDDENICLEQIKLFLEGRYEVEVAETAKEGLRFLHEEPPFDLVLLDLMLPDLHGLEVLKKIRYEDKTKSLIVIVQTGLSSGKEMEEALKIGANSFITKPFKRSELLDEIKKLLISADFS